jgi:hypothetical protein
MFFHKKMKIFLQWKFSPKLILCFCSLLFIQTGAAASFSGSATVLDLGFVRSLYREVRCKDAGGHKANRNKRSKAEASFVISIDSPGRMEAC